MAISEYNKVSFITSSSTKIPKMLNRTGSLIVLSSNLSNGHKRTSLWLRGNLIASGWGLEKEENMNNAEWIAMSYNPIFSQTFGMSYFSPEQDVVETIDNPRSVEMWLKHNHNYTDTCYNNLYTYASDQFSKINKDINGIKTDIGNIDIKLNKYKDETYTYVATAKENCYTYTKYWVDRIIGGAPDFLDSLDEIKNFLKNDRENHMATLAKIQNIDKYSVKREYEITKDGKQYTYITENSSYEYVDKFISDHKCKLLSKTYKNNSAKLDIQCSCGELFSVSFNKFKAGQQQCKKCGMKNRTEKRIMSTNSKTEYYSYEKIKNIIENNSTVKLISKEYNGCFEKLELKCECGNHFKQTFNYINQKIKN